MSERIKTAMYRKCCLTDGQNEDASEGKNLESLLEIVGKCVPRPWKRPTGISNETFHLLTDLVVKNGCLCGEIALYENGREIPLIDVDDKGGTWRGQIKPSDKEGKERKFQEQSLYFAVRENHVAIIQTTSLHYDVLEKMLSYLIQDQAKQVNKALIHLRNPPAKSALEKLKKNGVKGFKFGNSLFTEVKTEHPDSKERPERVRKRYIRKIEVNGVLKDLLLKVGASQAILDDLEKSKKPGSVEVDIQVRYTSRTERDARALVMDLADTLGKNEDLETEIILSNGSKIKNEELCIRDKVSIQSQKGCISSDDAFSKLSDWLAQQIKSGKI